MIVEALQLEATLYLHRRSQAESNPSIVSVNVDIELDLSDVELSEDVPKSNMRQSKPHEYRAKKKISSDIFCYIIEADKEQMHQMKLTIDKNVHDYWRQRITSDSSTKLDDLCT